jgi:hypothetical protein
MIRALATAGGGADSYVDAGMRWLPLAAAPPLRRPAITTRAREITAVSAALLPAVRVRVPAVAASQERCGVRGATRYIRTRLRLAAR